MRKRYAIFIEDEGWEALYDRMRTDNRFVKKHAMENLPVIRMGRRLHQIRQRPAKCCQSPADDGLGSGLITLLLAKRNCGANCQPRPQSMCIATGRLIST